MEKIFNITNYQRNGNQNHNEIPPHICQNGYHQDTNMTNDGQDAEKQGPPCTVGGTVNWCSHYGKRNEDSLKFFNGITISFCNFSSGYLPEENKNTNLKRHMHPMFITALLTKAMMWIQLKMSIN